MNEEKHLKQNEIMRMTVLAMLIAFGVVLSPILRVPGMAPMQHFINVICAVLLGPWYTFTCALLIGIIRMMFFGVDLLAITGAVFGAILSGYFYVLTKKIYFAVIGEIIGTGIIGAIVSYPIIAFVYGNKNVALFTYIPSFLLGTIIGGSLGFIFLINLKKQNVLKKLQDKLWGVK